MKRLVPTLAGALVLTCTVFCNPGEVKAKGAIAPSAATIARFDFSANSKGNAVIGTLRYTESDKAGKEAQPRFFVASDHLTSLDVTLGDAHLFGDALYIMPGMRRALPCRVEVEAIDNSTALDQGTRFLRLTVTATNGAQIYTVNQPLISGVLAIAIHAQGSRGSGVSTNPGIGDGPAPSPGTGKQTAGGSGPSIPGSGKSTGK